MPEPQAINPAEGIPERQAAGAAQLDDVAGAVHRAADELQNQIPVASDFVHGAASRLEQGAEALRTRSISDLMASFTEFGRKEPLALFGGAVIAGFAAVRFLKSSTGRGREVDR
jgi:hypothetical protein